MNANIGIYVRSKGQSAVEFALILVVLLSMVYGIMEISRLVLINTEIENAAKEGAHYAALNPRYDANAIWTREVSSTLSLASKSLTSVSRCFPQSGSPRAFNTVRYKVTYNWTSLVNIMPDMNTWTLKPLGPIQLQATSTKLIEVEDQTAASDLCNPD